MLSRSSDHPITRKPAALITRSCRYRHEQGYILLTLVLMVALMVIAMAAVLPSLTTQIRRDREQELIHRGAQYARAIKRYYYKTKSYPTTIDQLISTNNIRFLRKRYKDPITGQDFRLLRYGDVQLSIGQGGFQANVAGGAQAGPLLNSAQSSSASSSSSSSPFISVSQLASQGSSAPSGSQQNTGSPTPANQQQVTTAAGVAAPPAPSGSTPQDTSPGSSPTGTPGFSQGTAQGSSQGSAQGTSPSSGSSAPASQTGTTGPTFGGGPIIGVASTSPKKSFHVFDNKDHYKDWAFVYDPATNDRGLITGPYNGPPKFGTGTTAQIPGATSPGQSGASGSGSSTQAPSNSPFSPSPSPSPFSQSPSPQP